MSEEQQKESVEHLDLHQKSDLKKTLFTSGEGRCLLMGVGLAFVFTLWLGVKLLLVPEDSQVLIGMTATQIIFGRAAGLAFGYSMGLEHTTVIPICVLVESIIVLIFYPLFVFSWRHLLVIKRLRNLFERIRKAAENRKDIVRSYGIAGLFVFVWLPFWMTGPLVGCVIGFMIGLRTWVNIGVVLSGTYVAIIGWAVFLRQFHERVASYSSYATMGLLVLLLFIIIVGNLLYRTSHENINKD